MFSLNKNLIIYYIKIKINSIDDEALKRAGQCIKDGGLVAFPTETVYGYVPVDLVNKLIDLHGGVK